MVLRDHTGLEMRPDLLHQELHQDGQPKRPMNSFMIVSLMPPLVRLLLIDGSATKFSRHRRPALQRQNPAMKTGEISGLLSDEWKSLGDVRATTPSPNVWLIDETGAKENLS